MGDAPERDRAGGVEEDDKLRRCPGEEFVAVRLTIDLVRERMDGRVLVRDDDRGDSANRDGDCGGFEQEGFRCQGHRRARLEVDTAARCGGGVLVWGGTRDDGAQGNASGGGSRVDLGAPTRVAAMR